MRAVSVWRVVGALVTIAIAVGAVLVAVRQPLSVVSPASGLHTYVGIPTAVAAPVFSAGPIPVGLVADQEIHLTETDVAVRLWLGPARTGTESSARIEFLAGPQGPSLRSGIVDLDVRLGPIVARIVPPLRSSELPGGGAPILRVAPVDDSEPIRIGMAKGQAYRSGRAFVNGDILPEDQSFMFSVARERSPSDILHQVWTLIDSPTIHLRVGSVVAGLVVVTGLTAAMAAPRRQVRTAAVFGVTALLAVTLVVVDRTAMSFFPGPDFNPSLILR